MENKFYYCPVCGFSGFFAHEKNSCKCCNHELLLSPSEYNLEEKTFYSNREFSKEGHEQFEQRKQKLFEEVIRTNPLFDENLCNNRDGIIREDNRRTQAAINRGKQILEKQGTGPKCPTCQSTNISRISGGKRWLSVGLFGLASSNIGKTMECKSCGYKW